MSINPESALVFPKLDENLKIGQIRRLLTNGVDAKLVVIFRVNAISQTADVILLDHNIDNATQFDFVWNYDAKEFRFGHVILKDFKGNIDRSELISSPVYAETCPFCIAAMGKDFHRIESSTEAFPFSHNCYVKGTFIIRILSDEWQTRNKSYEDFYEACNKYFNYEDFIARRETLNLFYSNNSTLILRKNAGPDLSLQEIRKSISTNKYAKMLVRS